MTESKEHARRLAKQLIEAEPPNYKATKPILAYSIRGADPVSRTPDSVTNTQSSKVRRWEQNDIQTHLNWRQSAK